MERVDESAGYLPIGTVGSGHSRTPVEPAARSRSTRGPTAERSSGSNSEQHEFPYHGIFPGHGPAGSHVTVPQRCRLPDDRAITGVRRLRDCPATDARPLYSVGSGSANTRLRKPSAPVARDECPLPNVSSSRITPPELNLRTVPSPAVASASPRMMTNSIRPGAGVRVAFPFRGPPTHEHWDVIIN